MNFVKFWRTLFYTDHLWWDCSWKFERYLCSRNFFLQLWLCLHLIYSHSYSFVQMSLDILFSNVSLKDTSYTKTCIMKELSWNSEKPNSRPGVPVTLLKRYSSTGDFLWILRNSQEHFFYRKPPDGCFRKRPRTTFSVLGKVFPKWILFNQTEVYNRVTWHTFLLETFK